MDNQNIEEVSVKENNNTGIIITFWVDTILFIISFGLFIASLMGYISTTLLILGVALFLAVLVSSIFVLVMDNNAAHKVFSVMYIIIVLTINLLMIFMVACIAPTTKVCNDSCDTITKCPG